MLMRTLLLLSMGAVVASCSKSRELENRCRENAKILVHNPQLWIDYQVSAHQNYLERAKEFPDTGKGPAEYAIGFEQKFGERLGDTPETISGEITRDDLWILKDGQPVAQYVNFYLGNGWPGGGASSCLGLYPALYLDQV